uniref:Uncharacterized protein n=1 Tax=Solanum tuberosum TaxID=4113 RepID=M1DYQ8_SOLTU
MGHLVVEMSRGKKGDPNRDRRTLPRIAFCLLFRSSACVQIFFSNLWRADCPSPNRSATNQLALLLAEITLSLAPALCKFRRYHCCSAICLMPFSIANVVTSSRAYLKRTLGKTMAIRRLDQ